MKIPSMASAVTVAILCGTPSIGATIQLSGIRNPQDTAVVTNPMLSGNVYTLTIENTAPTGVIANVGLGFGNTLRLASYTTSAPFQYNVLNNTSAPDFNFPLDFALAGANQTLGLVPGESETYSWTLATANGTPLSVSALDIAQHQVVRFRLLPTATGTDLAVGPSLVPEPATVGLVGLALFGIALRVRSKAARTQPAHR